MTSNRKSSVRVLFAGYAPVHFVCFKPLYDRLIRMKDVEVVLSGGREEAPGRKALSATELYRPFRIPENRIVQLDKVKKESFDAVFAAHVSGYFPKEDKERIQIFHGVSFRNMAVRRDVLVYDHLFIVGPYMRRLFTEQQLLRKSDPRLVDIGFPKLDALVNGSLDRAKILKQLGFSGRRPVVLYAPTGQKDNSLEHQGEAVLERLYATNKYDVLIKLHDHPRDQSVDWPKRLKPMLGKNMKLAKGFDIVPYLAASDLLITDASSVSNEFSLLDRPMVFLDVPRLIANMKKKGVALDLDTWGRKGGAIAHWPDEAVDAVDHAINNPKEGSKVRQAMAKDLFFNPGNATDAAIAWFRKRFNLDGPNK